MLTAAAAGNSAAFNAPGGNTSATAGASPRSGARTIAEGGLALGRAVIYGAVALSVLAGLGVSTYFWRQRTRAGNLLSSSPLERAEQLIASCETKLASMEEAVAELRATR